MKWINQIKQMRWWMFLPFGQSNMTASKWVMDAEEGSDRVVRNVILTIAGMLATIPTFLYIMFLLGVFK